MFVSRMTVKMLKLIVASDGVAEELISEKTHLPGISRSTKSTRSLAISADMKSLGSLDSGFALAPG
jgi:hypothetical protein